MKIVVFGLSVSSAWGNGHATLLRGLFRNLHAAGHEIHFFERDTDYYAPHRDCWSFHYLNLHLYSEWDNTAARNCLSDADVAMITSYCPDAKPAARLIAEASPWRSVFYDMDTGVTVQRLERGENVSYLPTEGLAGFDLVLTYTGGKAIDLLRSKLGAGRVAPLYGWVDPSNYYPVEAEDRFKADLSYLGTYAADRHEAFRNIFLDTATRLPDRQFLVGGAMYPDLVEWPKNIRHTDHVRPADHRAFYSSSHLTLNITRAAMAAMGYCPSGRLFEAAACGTALLSDYWDGLDHFFTPGEEILLAADADDAIASLNRSELKRIADRARARTLDCHTASIRAREFVQLLDTAKELTYVGHNSRCGDGNPHSTACIL